MIAGERITPSMSSQDVMAYRRLYVAGKLSCPTAIPHQEGRQPFPADARPTSSGQEPDLRILDDRALIGTARLRK